MGSQYDPAIQHEKSRTPHQGRKAQDGMDPEIVSSTVTKVVWQDDDVLTDEQRRERIAIAAYYLAERRGFAPGHEKEDWLAAEKLAATW